MVTIMNIWKGETFCSSMDCVHNCEDSSCEFSLERELSLQETNFIEDPIQIMDFSVTCAKYLKDVETTVDYAGYV